MLVSKKERKEGRKEGRKGGREGGREEGREGGKERQASFKRKKICLLQDPLKLDRGFFTYIHRDGEKKRRKGNNSRRMGHYFITY